MNRFIVSGIAKQHLFQIWEHFAETSLELADKMQGDFYQAFANLATMPGMGHYREEVLDKRYKFWLVHQYLVVYLWQEKPIRIVTVVHGARNLETFFENPPE